MPRRDLENIGNAVIVWQAAATWRKLPLSFAAPWTWRLAILSTSILSVSFLPNKENSKKQSAISGVRQNSSRQTWPFGKILPLPRGKLETFWLRKETYKRS